MQWRGITQSFAMLLSKIMTARTPNARAHLLVTWSKTEARARVGRPQTSSSPPVIFIAGRPKAALLFWFFGDFRCGALLFMVIHVIYKYKNK